MVKKRVHIFNSDPVPVKTQKTILSQIRNHPQSYRRSQEFTSLLFLFKSHSVLWKIMDTPCPTTSRFRVQMSQSPRTLKMWFKVCSEYHNENEDSTMVKRFMFINWLLGFYSCKFKDYVLVSLSKSNYDFYNVLFLCQIVGKHHL